MIYIPTKYLKPNMILAQSVNRSASFFSLLVEGQQLTEISIKKLLTHNIQGVYIKSTFSGGSNGDELMDSEFKNETVTQLKKVYDKYASKKVMSIATLNDFSKLSETLIVHALSQEDCLINVIEVNDYDTYTYTHSMDVAILCVMMGIKLGYSRSMLKDLAMCGLMHDIGKIDVPIDIINKPDKLTDDEFAIIKNHPTYGVNRLEPFKGILPTVIAGIASHHERFDGSGYPKGIKGDKIPVYGRIITIADVYDALTSQRTYRKAWSSSDVIEYMMGEVQTHFDYELLKVFLKTVAAYPLGTIVKLSNHSMGVVTGNTSDNSVRPKVKIFSPPDQVGTEIDLATDMSYLNVTVIGTIEDGDVIPDELLQV